MDIKVLDTGETKAMWGTLQPMFQRVVDKAVHGEYSTDDIYRYAMEGQMQVLVAFDKETPTIAMVFETVTYPSGKAGCNVLAMAGKNLDAFMHQALPPFIGWCRQAGYSWIECSVSPAMERIHHRYGFKTVYRQLRINTGEQE